MVSLFWAILAFLFAQGCALESDSVYLKEVRDVAPVVPRNTDPKFVNIILDAVNTYRGHQGADNLTWDSRLATFASSEAAECDFGTDPEPYGELIGGVFPSTFGKTDWSGVDLNKGVRIIVDGWYNASSDYVCNANSERGKLYEQLVWKNTKTIGCAWMPYKCTSFIPDPPMYLICEFNPRGAVEGYISGNVTCNNDPVQSSSCNCSSTRNTKGNVVLGKDDASALLHQDRTPSDLRRRTGTPTGVDSYILSQINSIRAAEGRSPVAWLNSLAGQAQTEARACDGSGSGNVQAIQQIFWPKTNEYQAMAAATLKDWSQHSNPNHIAITSPLLYIGCGWSSCIDRYYLYCDFSSPGPLDQRLGNPHKLNARGAPDAHDALNMVNLHRLTHAGSQLTWSGAIAEQAQRRADRCDGVLLSGFMALWAGTWPNSNPDYASMTLEAFAFWGSENPDENVNPPPHRGWDWAAATYEHYQYGGCAWSQGCSNNRQFLYCEFAVNDTLPAPAIVRRDELKNNAFDLPTYVTGAVNAMRTDANAHNSALKWNKNLADQAQIDADKCNTQRASDEMMYLYPSSDAPFNVEAGTKYALGSWLTEFFSQVPSEMVDYDLYTEPSYQSIGCAWSAKCGTEHYFKCRLSKAVPRVKRTHGTFMPTQWCDGRAPA